MNPQPEPYVGNLFAILFGCLFIYYAIKAYREEDTASDLFVIGYVEESNQTVNNISLTNVSTKASLESQQLYIDCIEALRSLGMKKTEATKRTKQVFANTHPEPQTVQEFLLIALRK